MAKVFSSFSSLLFATVNNSTKGKGVGDSPDHSDFSWVTFGEGKSVGNEFPDHPDWSEESKQEHLPATPLDASRGSRFSRYPPNNFRRMSEPGVCGDYLRDKLITWENCGAFKPLENDQCDDLSWCVNAEWFLLENMWFPRRKKELGLTNTSEYIQYQVSNNQMEETKDMDENEDHISSMIKSLIINDLNSKPKILSVGPDVKTIADLLEQISLLLNLPLKDLRCVFKNKELIQFVKEPLEGFGFVNGDILDARLRINGGSKKEQSMNQIQLYSQNSSISQNQNLIKREPEILKYGMELESVFGQMVEQVGQLGQYCRQQFKDTKNSITSLQETNESMGTALTELIMDRPRINNALETQNNIINSVMTALKMTKEEVERVALFEEQTRNYAEQQVMAMDEWRANAEPKILAAEDCTKRVKEASEKLQAEFSQCIPIIKRLANYEVEKQDTNDEIRKLKAEITQMRKTQELSNKDIQLLQNQVKELLDVKCELQGTQLAQDAAIQKLQDQHTKSSKNSKDSSGTQRKQETNLLKSLDATTTIHDKSIQEIEARIERIEEHLLDPDLLEKAYKKELTDHSRRTDVSIEEIELKLNKKLNEEATKRQEINKQIELHKKDIAKIEKLEKNIQTLKESQEDQIKKAQLNNQIIDTQKIEKLVMNAISTEPIMNEFQDCTSKMIKEVKEELQSRMEKIHKDINFIKETDITKQMQQQIEKQYLKIIKVDEDLCGRIAEVNNRLTSFKIESKNPTSSTLSECDINRIETFVDANIKTAMTKIDATLQQIKNQKGLSDEPPSISAQGNQILYTTNTNGRLTGLVEPESVKVSCDGSLSLRNPQQNKTQIARWKATSSSNKTQPHNYHTQSRSSNRQYHINKKQDKHMDNSKKSKPQTNKQREKDLTSYNVINKKDGRREPYNYHSFQKPPQAYQTCKFGSKCWNRDCNRRHPKESTRNNEILTRLGFLERMFGNIQNVYSPPNSREWDFLGRNQRETPAVQQWTGRTFGFY